MATTKINTPELFELESSTSAVRLPSGTTAERPSSANAGDFRYNTDNNNVEYYDGSDWFQLDDESLPPIPSENFNTVLYTGNGTSQSITGVGFQPDLVWIKLRNTVSNHDLIDSVRGATKVIESDNTGAEFTESGNLTSFDSNGFSVGSVARVNKSNEPIVAWCWKAGGSAVQNTDGTIASEVSANPNAGFSIVKFTTNLSSGQSTTVGHGLSNSPELIITKNLDNAYNWWVSIDGISGFSQDDYLSLNQNIAKTNISQPFGRATSTVFSISEAFSGSGTQNQIAYCFHSVNGYQKIGTYTGNGSTNGPIVNTGFEPAMIIIKRTDSIEDWKIVDNKRNNFLNSLEPNETIAEEINNNSNFIAATNGFQINDTSGDYNANGGTYIYLAIASDPTSTTPTLTESFKTNLYTGSGSTQTIGGHLNGSAQFNGSSSISTNLNLDTSSAFSWSCWINISDKRSNGSISEILTTTLATSPFNGVTLGIDSPNLALLAGGSNQGTIISNPNVGQWYHIVITYNGSGSINCYVDSVKSVSIAYTLAQGGTLGIGDGPLASWSGYIGNIDQVRIFNSTLTDSQVRELYNETTTTANTLNFPTGAGCIAAYPLDSNSNDLSGNYNGTDTSMTYSEETSKNPSLVWIMNRTNTGSYFNAVMDTIRGAIAIISTNSTAAETTSYTQELTAFNSNGFSLGTGSGNYVNVSAQDYVAWNWGASTLPTLNSEGTIASIVCVNDAAGFSIVRYTGNATDNATVGTGLSSAAELVIVKDLDNANYWVVGGGIVGNGKTLYLNDASDLLTRDRVKSVQSNTFTLGSHFESNGNNVSFIAYCWYSISGYSKLGIYTGNNTTSNTIYTTDDGTSGGANGFEPGWLLIKRVDASANWRILDNKRSTSNPRNKELYPNLTNSESTFSAVNFNSNSFEIITTDPSYNALNGEYLYLVIK